MNNKKRILSLFVVGILSTFSHDTRATTPTLSTNIQESTATDQTTPQKTEKKSFFSKIGTSPRCPYANTPLKKLTAEQLEEVHLYTQKNKMDYAFMIDLLERLITLSNNHAQVKGYKLQLADLHYAVHHLEKAAACYEDFGVMYPGSKENEYVLYKAMVCMFELSLDADRDQTNTKKTIILVKEFLKRAKTAELIQEAQDILQKCYDRLFDHEVYVFNFYTKKKSFVPAQKRLDYIIKTFPNLIKDFNNKIAQLADKLEQAKNPVKTPKKYLHKKFLA